MALRKPFIRRRTKGALGGTMKLIGLIFVVILQKFDTIFLLNMIYTKLYHNNNYSYDAKSSS